MSRDYCFRDIKVMKSGAGYPLFRVEKRGFSKDGLNYMKKNAEEGMLFTLNKYVGKRLDQWVSG